MRVSAPASIALTFLLAVTGMLAATLLWPGARKLFRFGPLHLDDLGLTLAAGLAVLLLLELIKPAWREVGR